MQPNIKTRKSPGLKVTDQIMDMNTNNDKLVGRGSQDPLTKTEGKMATAKALVGIYIIERKEIFERTISSGCSLKKVLARNRQDKRTRTKTNGM